ncbi:hypothetical protein EYF80_050982 [Liparis tanakae]|uniref:Uncharacterized protein n=1 Tax=Liparis tanakae TaxID=230148 RepID=A0A4Z2FD56_9TELE|nr:hypothetical protein EYF80_050982 [Liparis tanakae]
MDIQQRPHDHETGSSHGEPTGFRPVRRAAFAHEYDSVRFRASFGERPRARCSETSAVSCGGVRGDSNKVPDAVRRFNLHICDFAEVVKGGVDVASRRCSLPVVVSPRKHDLLPVEELHVRRHRLPLRFRLGFKLRLTDRFRLRITGPGSSRPAETPHRSTAHGHHDKEEAQTSHNVELFLLGGENN